MGFEAITGPNFIVPTPAAGDSSNQVANTAFVATALVNGVIASTGLSEATTATTVTLAVNLTKTSASLGADVTILTSGYTTGPTVAQGTTGTWLVTGQATMFATTVSNSFFARLTDGVTIIDSCYVTSAGANFGAVAALSGFIASPAGNLRIDAKSVSTTAKFAFNTSGDSKDCTISAIRIG